jgi:membrane-bound ClpP family serine protease
VNQSRLKFIKNRSLAMPLLAHLLVAGCAFHKAPTPPPLPTFPAVPESSIQELRQLPSGGYEKVALITIDAEVGPQLSSAMISARQSAAEKGVNAVVIVSDTEFLRKVGKRRVKVRRIVYLAIHRR